MRKYNKIGFIGLGIMGLPMAANLLRAGYELVVFDINQERIRELPLQERVTAADSIKDVSSEVDVVILMLPNTSHVEEVILGENGLANSLFRGSMIIDMSSISPIATKELGARLSERDIDFIDSPVSGGQSGAKEGNLTLMVGGDQKVLEELMPLFSVLSKKIVHCGEQGAGQVVKVVNQLMSAVNLISMAEGFSLGVKGGVDPKVIHEVISTGSGCSWAVTDRVPAILDRNFNPGFTIDLHIKDLQLALEMAKEMNVSLYATALTHELFKTVQHKGNGAEDNSGVVKLYEELAGVEVSSEYVMGREVKS